MKRVWMLTIIVMVLFVGCASKKEIAHEEQNAIVLDTDEVTSNDFEVKIKNSLRLFDESLQEKDINKFRGILTSEDMLFVRMFLSGNDTRGEDVFEYIEGSSINENMSFSLIAEEFPIELDREFDVIENVEKIEIIQTDRKLEIQNTSAQELLQMFSAIVELDSTESINVVYVLEEGSVLYAQFSGSGLQYSKWVAFREVDGEYKIELIGLIY